VSRRRQLWILVGSLVVVAVLFVAVFPARTYLDQRRARQQVAVQIRTLDAHNRALQKRVQTLHTDAEVERLARQQYDLVSPPTAASPHRPAPHHQASWWSRAWDKVTSIL
jgi:cell division protein FtsB